jgi:hypothetical protein
MKLLAILAPLATAALATPVANPNSTEANLTIIGGNTTDAEPSSRRWQERECLNPDYPRAMCCKHDSGHHHKDCRDPTIVINSDGSEKRECDHDYDHWKCCKDEKVWKQGVLWFFDHPTWRCEE